MKSHPHVSGGEWSGSLGTLFRAHSSAWLERFPDKEEVDGSSPSGPTRGRCGATSLSVYLHGMKKLLLLAILAGVGYLVFRQVTTNQNDDDLWSEVGADQDLR